MDIYVNQTDLTIRLSTGKNLTGATAKIRYKNPKGTIGEWTAEIENIVDGVIKYNIIAPLVFNGSWALWAKITDTNGLISIGTPTIMTVKNEGY